MKTDKGYKAEAHGVIIYASTQERAWESLGRILMEREEERKEPLRLVKRGKL